MWLFLILVLLLFIGLIVRMAVHESHSFARIGESEQQGTEEAAGEPVGQAA